MIYQKKRWDHRTSEIVESTKIILLTTNTIVVYFTTQERALVMT